MNTARKRLPHQEALRRAFEPHPVVHFVYLFSLFFTFFSLFFWLFAHFSSAPAPTRFLFTDAGRNAVVSIVVTIFNFIALRWRWSKERSLSGESADHLTNR